jgi:hypothetical protein
MPSRPRGGRGGGREGERASEGEGGGGRDGGGRRFQRDSQTRPRVATRARRGGVPAGHHPRFMGVRANLCVPGETCMAPASPSMVWDRTRPANPANVPVRFDRRSIIVKSALLSFSLSLSLSLSSPRHPCREFERPERRRSTE